MTRSRLAVTGLYLLVAAVPAFGQLTSTWNGLNAGPWDWNAPGNWNPLGVPNAFTVAAVFTDTSAGTVNISSSIQIGSITFNNPTTSYNLTSSASQTMTLPVSGTIVMNGGGASSVDTINLASLSTGNLIWGSSGNSSPLTFTNTSVNGGELVVGATTVIGTPGLGGVVFGGAGETAIAGSFASGGNAVVGGLTKTGPGFMIFAGSGANLGGNVTVNGGTLQFSYLSDTSSKMITTGTEQLILGGGAFQLRPNSSTPVTQTIPGGTVVSAGHTDVNGFGLGTVTLSAGTISHNVGGTVDFTPSAASPTFSIQTSTGNTNGLLGNGPAFSTVNGGTNWAAQSGVVIAGLAGFSTNIYASNDNTDVTANANPSTFTTNSLRFNVPNLTVGLTGINTLQSGGILVTPSGGGDQIAGASATLVAGGGELIVHQYSSNPFTIGTAISTTTGLTKTGPGTLTLSGNNTGLNGAINVNRGSLTVSGQTAAVNSASAINFNDDRNTIVAGSQVFTVALPNSTNGSITPPIRLATFSSNDFGTYFSTGLTTGSTVTLSGVISSPAGLTTPIRFTGEPLNSSGFDLTNTNTFTGNVSIYQGSLGITSDANLGNSANQLFLQVSSATAGGLVFLNGGITVARPVVSQNPTRIVSNGTDSNTISGLITGGGGIYKDGTGTLTLTNSGNTVTGTVNVLGGTLSLGSTGALLSGPIVTVNSGATFTPGTTGFTNLSINTLNLNGGTFSISSGTGNGYLVNQLTTGALGGTLSFTGAGSNSLLFQSGAGVQIAVNGNSTWSSPGNGGTLQNSSGFGNIVIAIPVGVTLNNGIALSSITGGFQLTGGGTLYQNSDATNVTGMTAPVIVTQSTFRVTDASSNGGLGNLGAGGLELDGGTFSYGGVTATTVHPIVLSTNGGTIQIESATAALTILGAVLPIGTNAPSLLTKAGPGTLILNNAGNAYSSLTINAGTVQTVTDLTLGAGSITINPGGTLSYNPATSTSTTRTININSGTLTVAGGSALILNGATVNGGFLRGGGVYVVNGGTSLNGGTTFASTTITQNGAGSYTNFTNGGTLTVNADAAGPITMNGFSNEGSASMTVGARAAVGVADFQTYGVLSVSPANLSQTFTETTLVTNTGTSQLYFNGGSRTFVGTPATAVFPSNWPNVGQRGLPTFVAGIDLNGKNATVAGGLFVNNGYIEDSTNNFQGPATIIADFGSLVKGAGYFQNSVQTINGGKFQAGNSPGSATFGKFVLGPGGVSNYVFAIDDATGAAGPSPDAAGHVSGWGLVRAIGRASAAGDFTWTATPADKLTFAIQTLLNPTTVGVDVPGMMDHFDPNGSYQWPAVEWTGTYIGPGDVAYMDAATAFDTTGFANPVAGTFGWALDAGGHTLSLTYTPSAVPEPGTLALTAIAALGWTIRQRPPRRRKK
jgi:autotransporter-associated beta strand protein